MNKVFFNMLILVGLCTNVNANDDVSIMDLKELTYYLMIDIETIDANVTTKIKQQLDYYNELNTTVKSNKLFLKELSFLNDYKVSTKLMNYLEDKQSKKNK